MNLPNAEGFFMVTRNYVNIILINLLRTYFLSGSALEEEPSLDKTSLCQC